MTAEEKKAKREKIKRDYELFMSLYPFHPQSLIDEIWAAIEGYEGDYQISNYGRVKSLKRKRVKIMKPSVDRQGYLKVELFSNGKHKNFSIHVLVARAFIPNPENKPQVNHKYGIKFDCYFENLEWNTQSENIDHAFKNGLKKQYKGGKNPKAKLSNEQARYCREVYKRYDKEYGLTALAQKFEVSASCIKLIVDGKTYTEA